MARSSRYRWPSLLVLALALAALLLLGLLQYQWVGRVSQGERERMQASLRAGAARFAEDFDRELARAYLSFQMDAATLANRAWDRYANRYQRWYATAPHPRLVRGVFLVEVNAIGHIRLSRFNGNVGRFEPTAWPSELAGLRGRFERAYRPASETQPGAGVLPELVDEAIPALVVPLAREWILSDRQKVDLNADLLFAEMILSRPPRVCRPCAAIASDDPQFAHTIVTLDQDYITGTFIPELARRYFSDGDELAYQLAILSRGRSDDVIYRSDPQLPAAATGDASVGLFDVQFDELNQLALDDALLLGENSDASERQSQRVAIGILGSVPPEDAASSDRANPADAGRWRLVLTHRAGSLEAATAGLRLRNLAVGGGILLLLAASVCMLVVSTQRAQQLAGQKLEFAAAISHEMRTPLAVICTAGENLADGVVHDPQQARQYGALIRREGLRLAEMVEQALEFAGVQSGRAAYDLRPVDLHDLIESVLAAYQLQLREGGFTVEQSIPADLPPVLADDAALRRAIGNLVGNAIKYSGERRRIELRARAAPSARGPQVRLTVRDSGMGIAPAELPRIFEPFYRGRAAIEAQIRGSGLGLSLVLHIVEAHSGRVSVESALGLGSAFTLHLPAATARPVADAQQPIEGVVG